MAPYPTDADSKPYRIEDPFGSVRTTRCCGAAICRDATGFYRKSRYGTSADHEVPARPTTEETPR